MSSVTVQLEEIKTQVRQALISHGAADWIAESVADAVQKAEANGNLICGLYYLESYCKQLLTGRVNGTVVPVVSKPKNASVKVDAKFGFAQPAFARGLPRALSTVSETGSATLAICHSHTCTSLGYFTEQIAAAGCIGIGLTNASAVVSPPGALGKITMAAAAGDSIPLGWAVDSDGKSTTDPKAALKGSLVSTGGYKGYGFGLMAEVLAAAVTGSVNSVDSSALKAPEGSPHNLGQFYFLIEPEVYSGDLFWERIETLTKAVEVQEDARLPGSMRQPVTEVTIEKTVWDLTLKLASHKV